MGSLFFPVRREKFGFEGGRSLGLRRGKFGCEEGKFWVRGRKKFGFEEGKKKFVFIVCSPL